MENFEKTKSCVRAQGFHGNGATDKEAVQIVFQLGTIHITQRFKNLPYVPCVAAGYPTHVEYS